MDKYESIKLNKDFRYLYARGKSYVSPHIVVYFRKNKLDHCRLGITSGKKIGKAVKRNRARRLIRVAFRTLLPALDGCYDMVIVARTRCVYASSADVTKDLKKCFIQAGILKDENNH
ncbi:MAG: ribonuclease P protein component [Clostridia bacterium]|nr:ribonuclease P protein component [Clostridia bacterium]